MTTTKPLADLDAGDVIKTNEGRREWLRIVTIGQVAGDVRRALMEYVGGQRRGIQFLMDLHDYDCGWTTR